MSYQDRLASASAKVRRRLFDLDVKMKGRDVTVTRFFIEEDIYADERRTKISQSTVTMKIVYPQGEVPLQRFRTSASSPGAQETGLFFFDILPIEVYTQWADHVEIGDYIFQVIKDELGQKMGILLQIANMFGAWDTELVWRKGWAAPYNGDLPPEVKSAIDALLA